MSTPQDHLQREMRSELKARLNSWKEERATLRRSQTRIAELDALIDEAQNALRDGFTVTKEAPASDEKPTPTNEATL